MKNLVFGLLFLAAATSAQALDLDCFPQYSENSCSPQVSYGAGVYDVDTTRPSMFISKYMRGATVGVFRGDCTGNIDHGGLLCSDGRRDRFWINRVGSIYAGTFEGSEAPLFERLWLCREP